MRWPTGWSPRRYRRRIEAAVWPGITIAVAYAGYALGMLTQPARFAATPAYGILIELVDIRWWGLLYLTVAALFGVYVCLQSSRLYGIVVHIVGVSVTLLWLWAFVVRWLTDDATTIVNVVTWATWTLLIFWSGSLLPQTNQPADTPGWSS